MQGPEDIRQPPLLLHARQHPVLLLPAAGWPSN
jgi:hypothetical protein